MNIAEIVKAQLEAASAFMELVRESARMVDAGTKPDAEWLAKMDAARPKVAE